MKITIEGSDEEIKRILACGIGQVVEDAEILEEVEETEEQPGQEEPEAEVGTESDEELPAKA